MRIKIWASAHSDFPETGPYKMLDIVQQDAPYVLGDETHYGTVITIPPPIPPFMDDVGQSVIVKLNPSSLAVKPEESVFPKPPSSYDKIQFFPISVDTLGYLSDVLPPTGTFTVLPAENLTIENVSHLITASTFSLWKKDCFISKDTAGDLENIKFAIVHRYSSPTEREPALDAHSTQLLNMAVACLALVRPTRRSRAMNVPGIIKSDGTFEAQGFSATHQQAEVPEIQKLFTIRKKDIDLLTAILPEFIQLYQNDGHGKLTEDYISLRMAIQLYEQGYTLAEWKPRHILWWSAIEALYGSNEDVAMARIYAMFGNKDLLKGYNCPIYESGDIPSCYVPSPASLHTLGQMVPVIYEVRNASAHGQKVPDSHFSPVAHPFGNTIGIDALAEAATFVIRKTIVEILLHGYREKFKGPNGREAFWLYEFGMDKKQSKKKLREMKDSLGSAPTP